MLLAIPWAEGPGGRAGENLGKGSGREECPDQAAQGHRPEALGYRVDTEAPRGGEGHTASL